MATGLYDRYGEKVGFSGKIAGAVIGGVKWAAGKIANAAIQLKDMAAGGASKIKNGGIVHRSSNSLNSE